MNVELISCKGGVGKHDPRGLAGKAAISILKLADRVPGSDMLTQQRYFPAT
jgi:hypothetical protein